VIVTVTLNPTLVVAYDTGKVELGAANQVSRVRVETGGRGLAVARLLQTFGHEVVAAGLAGGSAGELIRSELAKAGVLTSFTRISAESRRVVRVRAEQDEPIDQAVPSRQLTSFEEPSPYITTEELGRLAADYRTLLDGATAVVLCGSLPAGLPPETYGSLTSYATSAGVPVILDAGGSALAHAAGRGPALIIPEPSAGPDELVHAQHSCVVRQSGRGVGVRTPAGEWRAEVDPVDGTGGAGSSPAGFRDALVAGFVPGITFGWNWPDMLRHALALAASVTPAGQADLAAYEALLPAVKVKGPEAAPD
jgi:tagatose 6-phosphate kinase